MPVLLLTIVTCGIYGFYWAYKMGQLLYKAKKDRNMESAKDNSVLYVVLEILFAIAGYALMQNEIKNMAK